MMEQTEIGAAPGQQNRWIIVWLGVVCVIIFLMIVVGGVTRLTHSGLSMVDWQPIMGAVPPLNDAEWQRAFESYKQFPEYQKVNHGMQLSEFKSIFYWEYGHRLLGRVIGLAFFIPFVVFLVLKKIPRNFVPPLVIALVLGGAQGLLGWYMVKSGLVDMPRVSHYRLAAHLSLAMFLLAYLFWLILGLYQVRRQAITRMMRRLLIVILVLFIVQALYGAFVAGLRAGLGFNTYPLMDGRFMAEAATMMTPGWLNLFENGAMVQFLHRWVGALLLFFVALGWIQAITSQVARTGWTLLILAVIVQFLLGISTLLLYVPVAIASLHQGGAVVVMLCLTYLLFIARPVARPAV